MNLLPYNLSSMRCALLLATLAASLGPAPRPLGIDLGPFVGHVTPTTASIWIRCTRPGPVTLSVKEESGAIWRTFEASTSWDSDLCIVWRIGDLRPATTYHYRVNAGEQFAAHRFTTAPPEGAASRVRIAFGSCAGEDEGTSRVWNRIGTIDVDAVVLLGDTPYIDSTKLGRQRRRYRDFASVAAMRRVLCRTPYYAIWDDHDFGRDNTDGNLPGKEHARRAFVEYHANPSYGNGQEGVYTKFRNGPVEVFLLDGRYFARTEPSPVSPQRPTLLGTAQWEWLKRELKASQAPFKVLACGMVFNEATWPGKPDHWGAYPHEREALFKFIGENRITGVLLVAGDIHRSRVIRHASKDAAGYDLLELITSPMLGRVIRWADVPHPGLLWDRGEPNTFMLLSADSTVEPAVIEAQFMNASGDVIHHLRLESPDLSPPS